MDYLVGEGINSQFDKQTLRRLRDLNQLEADKKRTALNMIDTYIRDHKARQAYSA